MPYKALQATLERRVGAVHNSKNFPLMAGRFWILSSAITWAKQGVRHFTYRASYFFSSIFFSWSGHLLITIHGWVLLLFFSDEKTNSGDFYYFYSKLTIFILKWGEGVSQGKDREEDATRTIRWVWVSKPPLKNARRKRPSPTSKTFVPGQEVRVPEETRQTPSESTVHGLFGATVNYLNTRW